MSILLAAATDNHVVLCADRQHTNMKTKEIASIKTPKITMFLERFGIANCGSAYTSKICVDTLLSIGKRGDVPLFSVEDVADCLCEIYSAFIEKRPEIELKCSSIFVVAGELKNLHLGFAIISNNSSVRYEIVDGTIDSSVKIFPPIDMTYAECEHIVNQSVLTTQYLSKQRYLSESSRFEKALRMSVQSIASKSQFVSRESMFWIYPR